MWIMCLVTNKMNYTFQSLYFFDIYTYEIGPKQTVWWASYVLHNVMLAFCGKAIHLQVSKCCIELCFSISSTAFMTHNIILFIIVQNIYVYNHLPNIRLVRFTHYVHRIKHAGKWKLLKPGKNFHFTLAAIAVTCSWNLIGGCSQWE